ncbi:MAG: hypothetical protein K1X48_09960, partial [Burkholderiaceae bacterium]|nr:hypothetical protein [Burkholderiaceae bacterium]
AICINNIQLNKRVYLVERFIGAISVLLAADEFRTRPFEKAREHNNYFAHLGFRLLERPKKMPGICSAFSGKLNDKSKQLQ